MKMCPGSWKVLSFNCIDVPLSFTRFLFKIKYANFAKSDGGLRIAYWHPIIYENPSSFFNIDGAVINFGGKPKRIKQNH